MLRKTNMAQLLPLFTVCNFGLLRGARFDLDLLRVFFVRQLLALRRCGQLNFTDLGKPDFCFLFGARGLVGGADRLTVVASGEGVVIGGALAGEVGKNPAIGHACHLLRAYTRQSGLVTVHAHLEALECFVVDIESLLETVQKLLVLRGFHSDALLSDFHIII